MWSNFVEELSMKKEDQIFSFSWCNDYYFFFHSFFFKMDFWNFGIVQCAINVRLQRDNSPASPLGDQDMFYLIAGILELCSEIVKRRSP